MFKCIYTVCIMDDSSGRYLWTFSKVEKNGDNESCEKKQRNSTDEYRLRKNEIVTQVSIHVGFGFFVTDR
jgi:hypothetical protein